MVNQKLKEFFKDIKKFIDLKKFRNLRLRKKIIKKCFINDWRDVWFYPDVNDIKDLLEEKNRSILDTQVEGYKGTNEVMFVGLNPSMSKFPTKLDMFFYGELKKNNFEKAHITDLIKLRIKNNQVSNFFKNEKLVNEQIEFLKKEIEIIDPKLIVTLGSSKGFKLLKEKLNKDIQDKIINIIHYSYRNNEAKDNFSKQMIEVKEKYLKLK